MNAIQCCLCTVVIEDAVATTEFPCHHKAHTSCFFRSAVTDGFDVQCRVCETLIVPVEMFHEILGNRRDRGDEGDKAQMKTIREELLHDKDFTKDANVFKGAIRELCSARHALKRNMTGSKRKFNEEIAGFLHGITQIRNRYIRDAKETAEYKRLIVAQRRCSYYLNKIPRKWNVHMRNMYRVLRKKNDYYRIHHLLHGAVPILQYAMRVRYIW